MVRKKRLVDQTICRFEEGVLAAIEAALAEGEKQSDFLREAVERELKRRAKRKAPT